MSTTRERLLAKLKSREYVDTDLHGIPVCVKLFSKKGLEEVTQLSKKTVETGDDSEYLKFLCEQIVDPENKEPVLSPGDFEDEALGIKICDKEGLLAFFLKTNYNAHELEVVEKNS